MRFRPLTAEINAPVTSAGAVDLGLANVVRAVNVGTTARLVNVVDAVGNEVGSMTLIGGESVFIDKVRDHKVYAASTDVKITSVTYPI